MPAKKTTKKTTTKKKPATKKVAAKKATSTKKKTTTKKAAAPKKTTAKKATAKKTTAKKTTTKKATTKKAAPKKATAKKATAKKTTAKKTTTKKTTTKKAAPKKTTAKKATAKKTTAKTKKPAKSTTAKKVVRRKKKIIKEPTIRYSDADLEIFKARILEMKADALEELRMLKERLDDLNSYNLAEESMIYSMHMAEQGTEAMEKEKTYAQIQRINEYIKKLDEALERIKLKTYGICRVCNCLIAKERLLAVPVTTLSASYKIHKKCPEDGIDRIEPLKK
jgi:RNA polymerase-binding transcription factor DksA